MAARAFNCNPTEETRELSARDGALPGPGAYGRSCPEAARNAPAAAISRPLSQTSAAAAAPDPFGAGFVAQRVLADLLFRKRARRVGAGLVACGGKDYRLREAVRVLGRSDGHSDPYGLTGVVETLDELLRAGARLSGVAMRLGSVTYRVERGVIASHASRLAEMVH